MRTSPSRPPRSLTSSNRNNVVTAFHPARVRTLLAWVVAVATAVVEVAVRLPYIGSLAWRPFDESSNGCGSGSCRHKSKSKSNGQSRSILCHSAHTTTITTVTPSAAMVDARESDRINRGLLPCHNCRHPHEDSVNSHNNSSSNNNATNDRGHCRSRLKVMAMTAMGITKHPRRHTHHRQHSRSATRPCTQPKCSTQRAREDVADLSLIHI